MPGEKELSSKEAIRASWIMVKDDDGMWRISVYHNCPRDPAV
jgi:ketosteroid isomerase-like protein